MLSSAEQVSIQAMIDGATKDELERFRDDAEGTLSQANALLGARIPSRDARKSIDLAIEVLTRLDARTHRGGWWYRAKRRPQLIQMYFG